MYKRIFVFLICLWSCFSSAQVALDWAKRFGSINNQGEQGQAILTDASGNVYTAGFYQGTTDFDPGPGVYNLTVTAGNTAIFILKLDANGNFVWAKGVGGAGLINVYSMTSDPSGNLLLTGGFQNTVDFDPGPGIYTLTPLPTSSDAYVLKLDANGNFIWARKLGGGTAPVTGYYVSSDGVGNVYSVGRYQSTQDFDPGPGTYTLVPVASHDIYISKLTAAGNFVWAKSVGGTSSDNPWSIKFDGSHIYICGEFSGTADFDPGPGTYTLTAGSNDGFILKLDTAGIFTWLKRFGAGGVQMNSMYINSGYIYNSGSFYTTVDFDPGPSVYTLTVKGNSDAFVTKLDTAGNFYWARAIGGISQDWGFAITSDNSGNVYCAGEFLGTCDLDPGPGAYTVSTIGSELFLTKLDAGGNFIFGKTVVTSNNSRPLSLEVDALGSIYCAGFVLGVNDFDPGPGTYTLSGGFSNDAFVFKWSPCTLVSAPGTISGNTIACSGSVQNYSVTLVSGATNYIWSLPGSWTGSSSNNTISVISGSTSGNVSVSAVNACGMSSPSLLNITINPSPTITVNSGSICSGTSFTMSPSGASTYTFQGGSAIVSPTINTSYTVAGTSSVGCVSNSSAISNVTVNPIPIISVTTSNTLLCVGQTATLTGNGASSYTWNPGGVGTSITVSPTITSTYTISGTNVNGCMNSTSFMQNVSGCVGLNNLANENWAFLIWPNPNNGILNVKGKIDFKIQVYNLLGLLVYETKIENEITEIDLSKENSGIFFIRIGSLTKKIIKE